LSTKLPWSSPFPECHIHITEILIVEPNAAKKLLEVITAYAVKRRRK